MELNDVIGTSALFVAMMLSEAATTATPTAAANPDEKIICRRQLETGSWVKAKKICHTRAEWARLSDLGRRDAEDLAIARNGTNESN